MIAFRYEHTHELWSRVTIPSKAEDVMQQQTELVEQKMYIPRYLGMIVLIVFKLL